MNKFLRQALRFAYLAVLSAVFFYAVLQIKYLLEFGSGEELIPLAIATPIIIFLVEGYLKLFVSSKKEHNKYSF